MTTAANLQRSLIAEPTSYQPSQRVMFEFPLSADVDVIRWRRMGASWATIAKNFGCSEDRVRKEYDPTYQPLHEPAKPVVASKPKAEVKPQGRIRGPRSCRPATSPEVRRDRERKVLLALDGGPRTSSAVAAASGLMPAIASEVLQALKYLGQVKGEPCGRWKAHDWRLTAAGRARVAGLMAAANG